MNDESQGWGAKGKGWGQWFKSSFSSTEYCVEVKFETASACKPYENCVEVGFQGDGPIYVRDSKNQGGPVLAFTGPEWDAFIAGAKAGEFDRK